jgi:hypothetical protein
MYNSLFKSILAIAGIYELTIKYNSLGKKLMFWKNRSGSFENIDFDSDMFV